MCCIAGVRLIIQFNADSVELADEAVAESAERCKSARQEPGCLQFEVFRSALQPERYVLLEHWDSPESLAVHAQLNAANPRPPKPGITSAREDYEYSPKADSPSAR